MTRQFLFCLERKKNWRKKYFLCNLDEFLLRLGSVDQIERDGHIKMIGGSGNFKSSSQKERKKVRKKKEKNPLETRNMMVAILNKEQ